MLFVKKMDAIRDSHNKRTKVVSESQIPCVFSQIQLLDFIKIQKIKYNYKTLKKKWNLIMEQSGKGKEERGY